MSNIYIRCKTKFAIFIEIGFELGWSSLKIERNNLGERIIDVPYARIILTPLKEKISQIHERSNKR